MRLWREAIQRGKALTITNTRPSASDTTITHESSRTVDDRRLPDMTHPEQTANSPALGWREQLKQLCEDTPPCEDPPPPYGYICNRGQSCDSGYVSAEGEYRHGSGEPDNGPNAFCAAVSIRCLCNGQVWTGYNEGSALLDGEGCARLLMVLCTGEAWFDVKTGREGSL